MYHLCRGLHGLSLVSWSWNNFFIFHRWRARSANRTVSKVLYMKSNLGSAQTSQWIWSPEVPRQSSHIMPVHVSFEQCMTDSHEVATLWGNTGPHQKAFILAMWKTDVKAASKRSQKIHMVDADRGHMLPNDKHVPLLHQDVTTVTSPN